MKRLVCIVLACSYLLLAWSAAFGASAVKVPPGNMMPAGKGGGSAAQTTSSKPADLPPAAQAAISAAIGRDDVAYHGTKTADGYQLVSKQDLTVGFKEAGAAVSGWRLSLAGIGRGDKLRAAAAAKPEMKANRVEYRRGNVTEWYVNGPLGLEQGFTIDRAPLTGRPGALALALQLPDTMKAEIAASRTDLTLTGKGLGAGLKYGKLAAWDATGKTLAAWFEPGAAQTLRIRVDDSGAQYPLTIDPVIELRKLTASDGAAWDQFGASVALSSDGNTALIGAYSKTIEGKANQGAVYVFTHSDGAWSQQGTYLTASDGATWDYFGYSVALSSDGDTALIGANYKTIEGKAQQGAAYVFTRSGDTWSQQGEKLTASDGAAGDLFGASVALSSDGNTALIGANEENSRQGAAYVFTRSGDTWQGESAYLTASDGAAGDYFGASVALSSDGNTALIGAAGKAIDGSTNQGAAYVFTRFDGTWSRQEQGESAYLTASDGAKDYHFGWSVALSSDGNTALIGAAGKDIGDNAQQGAAYVFTRSDGIWSQLGAGLTASDGAAWDSFGTSVALSSDGNTALIGAYYKTMGENGSQGAAYVFTRSGDTWSQQSAGLTASVGAANDYFGWSVALSSDGNTALIGAAGKAIGENAFQGAAYLFVLVPAAPTATAATTVTSTGFTANWGAVTGATGYRLDVATNSGFTSLVSGYDNKDVGNVTSTAVSGLTAGTTYYCRVRAYNAGGTSANSNTISKATIPSAPTATTATSVTATGLTANWGAVTGATGYRLDVATNSGFTSLVTGYSNKNMGNVTSFAVSGLASGTTYYYRVRAYNANGTSVSSNTISKATIPAAPVAPTATAATSVTKTGFTANWGTVTGATGYRLDVATNSGFTSLVTGYNNKSVGNVTSFAVSGLANGTTYYYRVRAYNAGGTSANSNAISKATIPAAPVATAATSVTRTGFTAKWGAVTGATGYRLDVATNNTFTSLVTGYSSKNVGNVTSFAVSGLTAGTTYYYRVRAYNAGGTSNNSNTISKATIPAAPTATAATSVTKTGFTTKWGAVTGATGYRLDVATNSTFTKPVTGYSNKSVGKVTSFAVSGLASGTTYYYRVRACNAGGTSANSNTIARKTAM